MMHMNQTFCIQLCQWHLRLYCTTGIHSYFIFFFLQQNLQSRDMGCVECMCVMTLLQEHVSCRHSDHHQVLPDLFFELTEWQQAGYKQKLKWTLECDRCDFKTTSKGKMFEHVATHQVSEFSQDCNMRYICWGLLFKQKSSALLELEHIWNSMVARHNYGFLPYSSISNIPGRLGPLQILELRNEQLLRIMVTAMDFSLSHYCHDVNPLHVKRLLHVWPSVHGPGLGL